jgi:hypothetical protein
MKVLCKITYREAQRQWTAKTSSLIRTGPQIGRPVGVYTRWMPGGATSLVPPRLPLPPRARRCPDEMPLLQGIESTGDARRIYSKPAGYIKESIKDILIED